MILKLDPRFPLVWRSPSSVQLGVDPAVAVVDDITPLQERLLATLSAGISDSGLRMTARGHDEEREALLDAISPALLRPRTESAPPLIVVSGPNDLTADIARTLAASGAEVVTSVDLNALDAAALGDREPAIAIMTAHYVFAPWQHSFWLRRDVPHLPVLLGDTAATVGPVIEPGTGPCLQCLALHRRDEDLAWPAIATQLLGRRSRAASPLLAKELAALVCRLALQRVGEIDPRGGGAAASIRIDDDSGVRTVRTWLQHPECGCRGIEFIASADQLPGRRGNDWASAARSGPAALPTPSSARASGARA
jgi:bacteriocin biosynthesis cyclodehydratase domain-containing protein